MERESNIWRPTWDFVVNIFLMHRWNSWIFLRFLHGRMWRSFMHHRRHSSLLGAPQSRQPNSVCVHSSALIRKEVSIHPKTAYKLYLLVTLDVVVGQLNEHGLNIKRLNHIEALKVFAKGLVTALHFFAARLHEKTWLRLFEWKKHQDALESPSSSVSHETYRDFFFEWYHRTLGASRAVKWCGSSRLG